MNKQEVYEFLKSRGIAHDIVEHPAAFTVEEVFALDLPEPESWAKNLFLRDKKKANYYLLVLPDEKRANLKAFAEIVDTKQVKFASEDDLMKFMKLTRGSVTPLGVLNDENCAVKVYIDSYFQGRRISVHPNDNTSSVYMDCSDLVDIITEHGNPVCFINAAW
ncbi:MAG: prolyl-tRNA synthetase associated domain-containing protein [Firmicutes bacterium]|nr:prolyl-tRNA synthetase associated domain-containing protein [Bacillota bacterium]